MGSFKLSLFSKAKVSDSEQSYKALVSEDSRSSGEFGSSDSDSTIVNDGSSIEDHIEILRRGLFLLCLFALVVLGFAVALLFWISAEVGGHSNTRPEIHSIGGLSDTFVSPGKGFVSPCGTTPDEARGKGCHFDPISLSWVAHECYDPQLVKTYMDDQTWTWYSNKTSQMPLDHDVATQGNFMEIYTSVDFRQVWCSYTSEKKQKDRSLGRPFDGAVQHPGVSESCHWAAQDPQYDVVASEKFKFKTDSLRWHVRYPACTAKAEALDADSFLSPAQKEYIAIIRSGKHFPASTVKALWDKLPAVRPNILIGEWLGGSIDTGLSQFDSSEWAGKSFRSIEDVDPVMVYGEGHERQWYQEAGHARIREVKYRGVVSAAMVYDKFAVIDHFRYVTDDLIAGAMDSKSVQDQGIYFFYIERIKET